MYTPVSPRVSHIICMAPCNQNHFKRKIKHKEHSSFHPTLQIDPHYCTWCPKKLFIHMKCNLEMVANKSSKEKAKRLILLIYISQSQSWGELAMNSCQAIGVVHKWRHSLRRKRYQGFCDDSNVRRFFIWDLANIRLKFWHFWLTYPPVYIYQWKFFKCQPMF